MINVTLKIIPMITSNIQLYKLFSVHANSDLFTADVLLVLSKCSLVTQKIIILFVHYMQKSSKIWLDAPALLLDFKIWKFSFLISNRIFRITTTCIKRLWSTNPQSIFPLWRKPFIIWPQWWHFLLRREIKNKQPQRTH